MKSFTIDPAQFLVDTMALDVSEVGAYMRLIVAQAASEQPIDPELLSGIAQHGNLRRVSRLFQETEGGWSSPMIARQIEEHNRVTQANSERGKAGAAARFGKNKPKPPVVPKPTTLAVLTETEGDDAPDLIPSDAGEDFFSQAQKIINGEGEPEPIGTALPPDFAMTGTMIAEAKVRGVDDMAVLADMFDDFKRYHLKAGTLSPDWHGSWDRWFERKKPRKPRAPPRVQVTKTAPEAHSDAPDDD